MADSHTYHRPFDPDSASDDDLDLDELDPIAGAQTRIGRAPNPSWTPGNSQSVPLRDLDGSKVSRLWKARRKGGQGPARLDEEAGLLREWNGAPLRPQTWSQDEEGWNIKQSRRRRDDEPRTPHQASRRQSFRHSVQLPEFVMQELADMQEDAEAHNAESRDIHVGHQQTRRFINNSISNAKYTGKSLANSSRSTMSVLRTHLAHNGWRSPQSIPVQVLTKP